MILRQLSSLFPKRSSSFLSRTEGGFGQLLVRNSSSSTNEDLNQLDLEGLQKEMGLTEERLTQVKDKIRKYKGADVGRRILVLGAGRSSSSLIQYFLDHSVQQNWSVFVGDADVNMVEKKTKKHPKSFAFQLDANNEEQLRDEIRKSDIVVSLLPVALHHKAQTHCLDIGRNLVTASYVSDYARSLNDQAKRKNLIFLNEVGLDPGIDHMISMKTIDEIKKTKGNLTRFESFCGGLICPDDVQGNPWEYKFTWNPRNVVLAGQGGCRFLQRGTTKIIPYQSIFDRVERLHIPGHGNFEGLANRDSLIYKDIYNIHDVGTIFRGTLRRPGYSKAWNAMIRLGLTDDNQVLDTSQMTYRQFTNIFLPYRPSDTVEMKVAYLLGLSLDGDTFLKLKWLGLFENELIGLDQASPAQVLQKLLEKKWSMRETDRDMIVMLNKFEYFSPDFNRVRELQSSMVVTGENHENTAMAMTVGLPAAICTKLILNGEIKQTGVCVPTSKEIYEPVLSELEKYGISFEEREADFLGDE